VLKKTSLNHKVQLHNLEQTAVYLCSDIMSPFFAAKTFYDIVPACMSSVVKRDDGTSRWPTVTTETWRGDGNGVPRFEARMMLKPRVGNYSLTGHETSYCYLLRLCKRDGVSAKARRA